MKRAGIAFCAAVNARRFDLLVQREQLPFAVKNPPSHYNLAEAFELRLFLDLMEQGGVSMDLAREIIVSGLGKLERKTNYLHPLDQAKAEGDLWLGFALIHNPAMGEGEAAWHSFPVYGRLAEVYTNAAGEAAQFDAGAELVRVVTVNASRAARFVRAKADELGLPEAKDFAHIWDRSNRAEAE